MKSLDKIAIVTLLAAFLGQSVSFETGIKDEILKANGKPKEEHFLSGKSNSLTIGRWNQVLCLFTSQIN